MRGGAHIKLGGKHEYVRLSYRRDLRTWHSEWVSPGGTEHCSSGKTQRECLDKLRKRVRGA